MLKRDQSFMQLVASLLERHDTEKKSNNVNALFFLDLKQAIKML